MSQMDRLPRLKKIKLPADALRPPEGSEMVGALPDGTVVWEGPIFAGNPLFQGEGPSDDGHERTPLIGPDGKQRWRQNKATGEKITPMHRGAYRFVTRRFIMADMGNGNGGPRPVPGLSPEEASEQERKRKVEEFTRNLAEAALENGYDSADEFVAAVSQMMGGGEPPPTTGRSRKKKE